MADNGSQNVADVEMSDVQSPPLMTEDEKRVLEVYDRLEQLQLEIALLKAQGVLSQDEPSDASEEEIAAAAQDLLKAKSLYFLRGNIIENVLITNPILRAVHGSNNATIVEQYVDSTCRDEMDR